MSSVPQSPQYPGVRPAPDGLQTLKVHCEEGLIENKGSLRLADEHPGAAIDMINIEQSLLGGYRRINGYVKFNTSVVPNYVYSGGVPTANPTSVPVYGVCVFGNGVIASRGDYLYTSPVGGSTWTRINTSLPFTGTTNVRFYKYNWASPKVFITTGVTKPLIWDGTTLTSVANAPANVLYATSFCNYMFMAGNSQGVVTWSAPLNELDYNAADGAGVLNVGKVVNGLKVFRDTLYIFCADAIFKLTGSNTSADPWVLKQVTDDIGSVGQDTIQEVGGDLVFLAPDGLRPISGTNKIGDVQLATIGSHAQNFINTHVNDQRICSVVIHTKSQYRLFFSNSTLARSSTFGLLATQGTDYFSFGKLQGIRAYCADSNFLSGASETIVHGDYDGYVYQQEVGSSFDGNNIQSVYQTPPLTFGDPAIRKTIFKMIMFGEYEGSYSINIGTIIDQAVKGVPQPSDRPAVSLSNFSAYDVGQYDSALYDDYPPNETHITILGSGYTFSFLFKTDDQNPPNTYKSFTVEYSLSGRQ